MASFYQALLKKRYISAGKENKQNGAANLLGKNRHLVAFQNAQKAVGPARDLKRPDPLPLGAYTSICYTPVNHHYFLPDQIIQQQTLCLGCQYLVFFSQGVAMEKPSSKYQQRQFKAYQLLTLYQRTTDSRIRNLDSKSDPFAFLNLLHSSSFCLYLFYHLHVYLKQCFS